MEEFNNFVILSALISTIESSTKPKKYVATFFPKIMETTIPRMINEMIKPNECRKASL
jgi:hypothetical protein